MGFARACWFVVVLAVGLARSIEAAPSEVAEWFPPLLRHPVALAASQVFQNGKPGQAARLAQEALMTNELSQMERSTLGFLYALSLTRSGKREQAIHTFRKLLDEQGCGHLAHHAAWHHGNLLLGSGRSCSDTNLRKAHQFLIQIPPSSRFGLKARVLLVRSLLAIGEIDEAYRLARMAVEHFVGSPREASALLLLASCKQRLGRRLARSNQWKQSRQLFREAGAVYQEVAAVWPHLLASTTAKKRIKSLQEVGIRPAPVDPDRLIERARRVAAGRHGRRGLYILKRIQTLLPKPSNHPSRLQLEMLYAELAIRYRWYKRATRSLRKVVKHCLDPELCARSGFLLAELTSRRQRQAAIQAFLSVQERWPDSSFASLALYKAGEIARRFGDTQVASRTFIKCQKSYPNGLAAAQCRWGLAWMALRSNQYEQALAWLDSLESIDPESDSRANLHEPTPEISMEKEELTPEEDTAEQQLAWEVEHAKEEEDQEDVLESSGSFHDELKHRRFRERVQYWRARTLERLGRVNHALTEYRRLVTQHPYDYYALMAWERLIEHGGQITTNRFGHAPCLSISSWANRKKTEANHPEVAAVQAYLGLGLVEEARATLLQVDPASLSQADRRLASLAWLALGDFRRSHRMASVPWEGGLSKFFNGKNRIDACLAYPQAYIKFVQGPARAPQVQPALLFALMRAESGFFEKACSPAKALGLTQMVRRTAYRTARKLKLKRFRFWKLVQPEIAVRVGSAHMSELLNRFKGHLVLALAAYNAGEKAVVRWLAKRGELPVDMFIEEIPYAETNRYVKKILSFYTIYRALYQQPQNRPLGVEFALPEILVRRAKTTFGITRSF